MDDKELRLECLREARSLGLGADETLKIAQRFYDFATGKKASSR